MSKGTIKLKILFNQNWYIFSFFIGWYIINSIVFYMMTSNLIDTLLILFFFTSHPSLYGNFYPVISEFVIFGILFSLITTGLYRKYNPKHTSLTLARSRKNHVIIIGYDHLGRRIRDYLDKIGIKWVIIEPNENLISDLIRREDSVIVDKAYSLQVLNDASIQKAKLVITTNNDLETLIVATSIIRDVNKKCKIVCRCFDDSIAQILEKRFMCKTISTSKYTAELIETDIKNLGIKKLTIIGYTNTSKRLLSIFKMLGIEYTLIEKNRQKVADILDDEPVLVGDAKDKDNLIEAGIETSDMAIVLIDKADEVVLIADAIRELNNKCHLICRFFYEDIGEVLEHPPFNAKVISQSKNALEKLIEMNIFNI
ncbi:MAG: NAD-binding protein [Candidatus Helarchaeota archaeon]